MNLDQQVISLQHAKRLKELGVNNDSFFAYFKLNMPPTYDDWEVSKQTNSKIGLPAYSVAELLDLLPEFPEPYKLNFGIEFNQLRETMGGSIIAYAIELNIHEMNIFMMITSLMR